MGKFKIVEVLIPIIPDIDEKLLQCRPMTHDARSLRLSGTVTKTEPKLDQRILRSLQVVINSVHNRVWIHRFLVLDL